MTLEQLFAFFVAQHKLKVTELLVKGKAIYSEVLNFSKNGANRPRPLVELIAEKNDPLAVTVQLAVLLAAQRAEQ